jgi:large subunit ribosomal protein L22
MESTAKLKYARVSAQKARLVANLVRGKDVEEAIEVLSFTNKKSAPIIRKLVESAVANAEVKNASSGAEIDVDDLFVEVITVDAGPSLRRFRPRARGRATKILKKTSHITVVLGTREGELWVRKYIQMDFE